MSCLSRWYNVDHKRMSVCPMRGIRRPVMAGRPTVNNMQTHTVGIAYNLPCLIAVCSLVLTVTVAATVVAELGLRLFSSRSVEMHLLAMETDSMA